MTDISEQISNAFYIIASGVLLVIFKRINDVKKDTAQVNNAVNHVEPGKKPLTQRIDRIEENLHTIQYDMDQSKKMHRIMARRSKKNDEKLTETKALIEGLFASHVDTKKELGKMSDKFEEMLQVMPKRKKDIPEGEDHYG